MDTNSVRAGAILICPVKVPGAGIYMGDMHAQQGNGEVAGHATDVSGVTEVKVEVIKGLAIDGPILLQRPDDLPPMARPMNREQRAAVKAWPALRPGHRGERPDHLHRHRPHPQRRHPQRRRPRRQGHRPVAEEILNRATIAGSIEISRLPGVVRVTFQCPMTSSTASASATSFAPSTASAPTDIPPPTIKEHTHECPQRPEMGRQISDLGTGPIPVEPCISPEFFESRNARRSS
jgi:hypothetical protein